MMGKRPMNEELKKEIKTLIENSDCGRKCILYPVCINKRHITCDRLYQLFSRAFIHFENSDYKSYTTLRTLLPKLNTFESRSGSKYLRVDIIHVPY